MENFMNPNQVRLEQHPSSSQERAVQQAVAEAKRKVAADIGRLKRQRKKGQKGTTDLRDDMIVISAIIDNLAQGMYVAIEGKRNPYQEALKDMTWEIFNHDFGGFVNFVMGGIKDIHQKVRESDWEIQAKLYFDIAHRYLSLAILDRLSLSPGENREPHQGRSA